MDGTEAADRFLDDFITALCCAVAANGLSACTPYVLNDGVYERLLVDYFLTNEHTTSWVDFSPCFLRRERQCLLHSTKSAARRAGRALGLLLL